MSNPAADHPAAAVNRALLLAAGTSGRVVDRMVRNGELQVVFPGTFAPFSGPIPFHTRLEAAVLYAGTGAALSHRTAAGAAGWQRPDRWPDRGIHVTIPETRRVAPQPGLVIHRSRRWTERDVLVHAHPPRTTVERTLLDLVAVGADERTIVALVTDAVRSGHTTPDRVLAALALVPRTPYRRLLLDMLGETRAGVHSPLELGFARLLREHGLPEPRRQFREVSATGEVYYLDTFFDPWPVVAELDGRLGHSTAEEKFREMTRDNAHSVRGRAPLRYGWANVFGDPCGVAMQVGHVLVSRGWPGTLVACRRPLCGAFATVSGGEGSAQAEGRHDQRESRPLWATASRDSVR